MRLKIRDPAFSDVLDLHLHKRVHETTGQVEYCLYVVTTVGVLLYQAIEKKEDCRIIKDEWSDLGPLTPNCTDLNSQGVLLVEAALKGEAGSGEKRFSLRRYTPRGLEQADVLEGEKEKVRFFRDAQIVELKQIKNGQRQLSIYDFANKLTVYCQTFSKVLFVEVEDDAVFLLVEVAAGKGAPPMK
jgi:hypothetical protein